MYKDYLNFYTELLDFQDNQKLLLHKTLTLLGFRKSRLEVTHP